MQAICQWGGSPKGGSPKDKPGTRPKGGSPKDNFEFETMEYWSTEVLAKAKDRI